MALEISDEEGVCALSLGHFDCPSGGSKGGEAPPRQPQCCTLGKLLSRLSGPTRPQARENLGRQNRHTVESGRDRPAAALSPCEVVTPRLEDFGAPRQQVGR